MPDVYANIQQQSHEVQQLIADAMEIRAATPQQQHMLEGFLGRINFPNAARVLEIGCGTAPAAEVMASWPGVAQVVGVDPSPVLLEVARAKRGSIPNLSFVEADGRSLPLDDVSFDVIVIYTTLCHVPGPERVLKEAFRVLRPSGILAIFDGDYETITVSKSPFDPFAPCVESFKENFIHDVWLMRKLPALITACGFEVVAYQTHGYNEVAEQSYMLTIIDRGADTLVTAGLIGEDLAEALKAEARRRAGRGEFFGHISYASLIANK